METLQEKLTQLENIEHSTSNAQRRSEGQAGHYSMFDVECWMFDVSVYPR
jgi:hypothetical protein